MTTVSSEQQPASPTMTRPSPQPDERPTHNEDGLPLYCLCRRPDEFGFMIECDYCKEW
ncbi:hypothetical protein SmJEL517_g04327 [Synchytrium microbalum]|uniref:Uncharacterized protein n=1 Tax=Synchytrium microbalum TaxID=1806994 RepID=A0A507BSM7_9FUNG|nr:uncharacterized protein SmJEL517_g04327 [Synchytrium microbalum]TPX32610.1 hypothetical protein SmJEL517_g04327 [Synchytrium microbalum]